MDQRRIGGQHEYDDVNVVIRIGDRSRRGGFADGLVERAVEHARRAARAFEVDRMPSRTDVRSAEFGSFADDDVILDGTQDVLDAGIAFDRHRADYESCSITRASAIVNLAR